ncbi:MAG: TetR/AcrR family transcriptional regulator [Spirochaetales bacterium]|nr:TetR/AcrR family transcriptional regulator [Spirochaetales bacterium]
MPRKTVIHKEDIINAAVEIVRADGYENLNARAIARRLGCSTQPLFSNFSNMEDLTGSVIRRSLEIYNDFVAREFTKPHDYPPYKTNGMAYIRFALEEKNLFKLLYMRDRTNDPEPVEQSTFYDVLPLIMKATGLDREQASLFHFEIWAAVHGIAVMVASSYYNADMDLISLTLTDVYQGLLHRFRQKEGSDEERN